MKIIIACLISLTTVVCFAGDGKYAISSIPQHLLKGANVVKRLEELRYEMNGLTDVVLHKKYALTILNENGEKAASFLEQYDKLREIKSIEGFLYDANGNLLKKTKNKDIQDVSSTDGISLVTDDRVKMHNFYNKVYPYTVEYEVEIKLNHTFAISPWMPQDDEQVSVEHSRFTVIVPENYNMRYRSFNYKGEPVISNAKGKKTMEWQAKSLSAITRPFASPVWNELTTCVFLAPSEFQVEGYKGMMNTWQDMGKFILALNKDRDKLPDNIIQQVKDLTAGLKDDHEKVRVLYNFLQKNTRYISIQLGIGGWQTFEASYVAQKGYGDCKALSNYMYSLLKAAGIKSYYTIIKAGNSKEFRMIMEDFPSNQANHAILCVPLVKDTMWLECTDQTVPAGYMGGFTGNRKALLITENGGNLVSTPRYLLKDNLQLRTIKGNVEQTGDFTVNIKTRYTGIQQDQLQDMINSLTKDKVKKILNEELDISTYDIIDFKYNEKKEILPQIDEQLELYVSKFATISGKRLFITPNLLNKSTTKLTADEERVYDFVFDLEYKDVDSVEIEIPGDYTIEAAPQPITLKTKFGSYSSSIKLVNNKLYYIRTREQYSGRFPPKDAAELSKFYDTIYKADRSRVVLVKNPTLAP